MAYILNTPLKLQCQTLSYIRTSCHLLTLMLQTKKKKKCWNLFFFCVSYVCEVKHALCLICGKKSKIFIFRMSSIIWSWNKEKSKLWGMMGTLMVSVQVNRVCFIEELCLYLLIWLSGILNQACQNPPRHVWCISILVRHRNTASFGLVTIEGPQ